MLPVGKNLPVGADGSERLLGELKGSQTRAGEGDASERTRSARKAARMLEGLFFRQLVKEMRRTVPEGGLFGGGMDQQIFNEMFDGAIADEAGKTGALGLSAALERHLLAHVDPGAQPSGAVAPIRPLPADGSSSAPGPARPVLAGLGAQRSYRFEPPRRPEPVVLTDGDGRFVAPTAAGLPTVDAERSIGAEPGSDVVASASGRVVAVGQGYLIVDHGEGVFSRYAQLGQALAQEGDLVLRGQTLGRVADGGRFGFDIRRAGRILGPAETNALLGTPEPSRR